MSRASLANIETGRQNVLLHRLYHLAGILEIEVTDLLPPKPEPTADDATHDLPLPKDLSPQQKAQIAHVLREDIPMPSAYRP